MKKEYVFITIISMLIGFIVTYFVLHLPPKVIGGGTAQIVLAPDPNANPFTKIGQMATRNGLIVEIYSLEHPKANCVVAVQQVPNELGRAMFQMVCK
jgi:hypothetical protein